MTTDAHRLTSDPAPAPAPATATAPPPAARRRTAERPSPPPGPPPGEVRRWWALTAVVTGQAMAVLDTSIVNVAIPTIRRDLGASGSMLELVVSGYTLAFAVLLVTGARLGTDHGHRRLFVGGLAGFVVTSLACGLAPNAGSLVAFRIAQGVAAAAMVPQVLSIIQRHFAGADRARALGIYATVISSGVAVGQVVGGLLTGADLFGLGWRPVFLVNVPIGIALLPLALRTLPGADHPERAGRAGRAPIDLVGVGLLSVSMTALVLPLVLGEQEGWPAWIWVSLALSPVGLAAFVGWCLTSARRGGDPVLDLEVLRAAAVRGGLAAQFLMMACWGSFLFTFTLFLQIGNGYSAEHSGLTFLTIAPTFAISSLWWSLLPGRLHRWVPTIGFLVAAPAYLGVGLLARAGWDLASAAPVLALLGLALGAAFSPLMGQTIARVRPAHTAGASGLLSTVTQLGIVVGVATLGTLYLTRAGSSGAHAPSALAEFSMVTAVLTLLCAAGASRVARHSSSPNGS